MILAAAILICMSLTLTEAVWNELHSTKRLMASQCFPEMERSWCLLPIVTARRRAIPTSSSRIGLINFGVRWQSKAATPLWIENDQPQMNAEFDSDMRLAP